MFLTSMLIKQNTGACMAMTLRAVLFAVFLLVDLPTASANSCLLSGPRYQLEADSVNWSMNITGGQSCIRGLRFSTVVLEAVKLITPPEKGQLKLYGLGFLYKAEFAFEGEDLFTISVSGIINKVRGSSTVHIVVRSAGVTKGSAGPRTQVSSDRPSPAASRLADCTQDVWHNLETCGWPGPKNTGFHLTLNFVPAQEGPSRSTTQSSTARRSREH